jgi:hypothetical protein
MHLNRKVHMSLLSRRVICALAASALLLSLATACGGNDDDAGGVTGATSVTSVTTASSTSIELPPGAFTADELTQLTMTDVPGFVRDPQSLKFPTRAAIRYNQADEGDLQAQVTVGPCDPSVCWDLVGITEQQGKELKEGLPERNLDDPDLIFEYGTSELLPGYTGFFTYSRSFVVQGATVATLNGYSLLYHDGTNWISVIVTPENAPLPDSAEELQGQMDQAKGETATKVFFEAFASNFAPN